MCTKSFFTTLLTCFIYIFCFSQSWYPANTRVYYEESSFGNLDVLTFQSVGSETIDGKQCNLVEEKRVKSYWNQTGPNDPGHRAISDTIITVHYLYENEEALFLVKDSVFHLLWDFSEPIGASWFMSASLFPDTHCGDLTNIISGKRDTTLEGTSFKCLDVEVYNNVGQLLTERTIIQGIGGTDAAFLPAQFCNIIMELITQPRCYISTENEIHFIEEGADCELKLSINTNSPETAISFYPNPSSNKLYINMTGASQVIIHNLAGKEVMNQELLSGVNEVDISTLNKGVHLATVKVGSNLFKQKILITD